MAGCATRPAVEEGPSLYHFPGPRRAVEAPAAERGNRKQPSDEGAPSGAPGPLSR